MLSNGLVETYRQRKGSLLRGRHSSAAGTQVEKVRVETVCRLLRENYRSARGAGFDTGAAADFALYRLYKMSSRNFEKEMEQPDERRLVNGARRTRI